MRNKIREYFSQLSNPGSLYDCTILLTYFTRYSGSNPFKFEKTSEGFKISISPTFATYGIALSLYYVYCIRNVLLSGETTVPFLNSSYIFKVASKIRIVQGFILISFLSIESSLALHRYSKTYSLYETVDKILRHRLGKAYKNILYISLILIFIIPSTIFIMCCAVYYTLSFWNITPSFEIIMAENYPDVISYVSLGSYGFYANVFREYIKNINGELKELLENIQNTERKSRPLWMEINDPNHEIRNRYLIRRIRQIWTSYDACCDIPHSHGSSYSYKFTSMLISTIFTVILNFFYLISILSLIGEEGNDSEFLKTFLVISAILCITKLLFIIVPILVGEQCKIAGNETADLVCKLLVYHVDNDDISTELQRFSTYATHRKPTLSLIHMFDLDNMLIFTIIGAIATYTIILIQFSLSPELKT